MSKECEIIRDLLPLYAEGMTSEASNEFIEEHLKNCPECTELLKDMREVPQPEPLKEESELPLKVLSKTYRRKNRSLAVLIASIAASVLISLYAWFSAPRYLDYSSAVESTQEISDGLQITFRDGVHHIGTSSYTDPDGMSCTDIECWTSTLDQLWHAETAEDTIIRSDRIWYRSNNNDMNGDVQLYGPDAGGSKTLRRLALNFYFAVSGGLTILLGGLGLLLRRGKAGLILQKAAWIPLSWCLASVIVERGIGAATWSLIRDVSLIVILWITLSIFFLCLDQRLREKKSTLSSLR
ncbi:MAG: zf-HC2 domain-containing protein [Solobacterium sp.]|nr:zf-HC2 domain-containing protein [Solobacterium sp.]